MINNFWDLTLPPNYYDKNLLDGLKKNKGIQTNWHNITFLEVKSRLSNDYKHLDFACGPGTFIGNYFNSQSIGVDISTNQINFAKKKYSDIGTFYTIDNFELGKYKNYFEQITVIGLIEYLDDAETEELIKNLLSILKTNGKIIFTTPNYGSSMYFIEKLMHVFGPINYSDLHKNRYNYRKLKDKFEKFKVKNYKIKKIINIGIVLSIFNLTLGKGAVNLISRILGYKLGYLFLIEVIKE